MKYSSDKSRFSLPSPSTKSTYLYKESYEGELWHGMRHGYGIYMYQKGHIYEGQWSLGLKHGVGRLCQSNGSYYIGQFSNGRKCGFGKEVIKHTDGKLAMWYEGNWKDNYKHGFGVARYSSGVKYTGTFHQNKYHGKGIYTFQSESQYAWLFEHGELVKYEREEQSSRPPSVGKRDFIIF